jgi:CIC family chloride channel protein
MRAFDHTQADELAVIDANREVIGILSEAYATRRYAGGAGQGAAGS